MKAPLWQYLIPKYGNFGGPGWSGGAIMANYDEVDWSIQPADSLDWCFYTHDKKYQAAIEKEKNGEIENLEMRRAWAQADRDLIQDIDNIPIDPKEWEQKPTKNSMFYAWLYRKLAIYSFTLKVWLYNLRHS